MNEDLKPVKGISLRWTYVGRGARVEWFAGGRWWPAWRVVANGARVLAVQFLEPGGGIEFAAARVDAGIIASMLRLASAFAERATPLVLAIVAEATAGEVAVEFRRADGCQSTLAGAVKHYVEASTLN